MAAPTTASRSIEISASAESVYDLLSDVTRTGEWSPECHTCTWLDAPGQVGSKFKGRNRNGFLRWTTTATVEAAERPKAFQFATYLGKRPVTRWRYELSGDGPVTLTESFESLRTPAAVALVERIFMRNRQEQLEAGIQSTVERIKAIAEAG
jgi:uncharacterized protein YndB with AHSA1/START domain